MDHEDGGVVLLFCNYISMWYPVMYYVTSYVYFCIGRLCDSKYTV